MNPLVSLVKCANYDAGLVYASVKKSLDLLGGITNFIRPDSLCLVKPNLLMAKAPECAITTHPEVVRAVIRMLKEINCRVIVGDSPSVWGKYIEKVDQVYEETGIKKVCLEEGAELVEFNKKRMRKDFPLTALLDECGYYINLPKFKTHGLTCLSGAIKNNFGLVPGTFKTELHKNYFELGAFANILVDIYAEARPALTIVDGIIAMEGEGPGTSGKPRELGLLLAGADCVALDSAMAHIMGIKPKDVLTTRIAGERNLGQADLSMIDFMGEPLGSLSVEPFKIPLSSRKERKIPKPIANLARKLIRYYPCVEKDNCIQCAACVKACPKKIIRLENKKIIIDYKECIACFCCQEVCPNSAIKIKKSFVARLLGL